MTAVSWEVLRLLVLFGLLAVGMVTTLGAVVYAWRLDRRAKQREAEQWLDEPWVTGEWLVFPNGYIPWRRRSRLIPVASLDESARRALREISTEHEEA